MNGPFLSALLDGWRFLRADPMREAFLAALFLLGSATAILLGPAAILWLWHLDPARPGGARQPLPGPETLLANLLAMERLRDPTRRATTFWLGLVIWGVMLLPCFQATLLGFVPVCLLLLQPLWLALVLADRFALPVGVACRAAWRLTLAAPGVAFPAMLLGLLGWVGLALLGIGVVLTLPIANRALLLWLARHPLPLSAAVQEAYR